MTSLPITTATDNTGTDDTTKKLIPGHVIHCSSVEEYHAALQAAGDGLVVVDVYADWCPPCQAMAPIFERLAAEYPQTVFIKVDVDRAPSLKHELSVWALPTFVFLKHGKKVGSFMGANQSLLKRGLENNGEVSICSNLACIVQ
ncbi:Thioredoxin H-type [Seminavis robusta]|uniref:Thioredoxin H-type n=1 Tax=Seminavis robusta TaxID=568900 RepID=A0A9N8DEP8_9STRA|nr:Thioredoxin H-type [Seminavis robusta]|eukprot:Sro54_g031890.1 Thioredoxin H-type (144) ;mRNA; f:71286-71717